MSRKTTFLNDDLYQYLCDKSLREPEILRELRQATANMSSSSMQISPEQGQLMRLLIKLTNAKKTLEVGVYTGYSALSVAMTLPDNGRIVACDINEEWTQMARQYWRKAGIAKKIDLRIAPAEQTLTTMVENGESQSYDFAFIDADKANYDSYYELCLELLRPGGLIMIDNTLWDGLVIDTTDQRNSTVAIRALNDKLLMDERILLSLLPIGDGVTIALKL